METLVDNGKAKVLALVAEGISKGMDYTEYRDMVHGLAKNRATTGPEQLESLINYTELNDRRMSRWDKTLKISEELETKISELDKDIELLVLTESWCGDASPSLPVVNKLAQLNHKIDLKIVLRDENPELMDEFLTNGSRSIPKLIVLDKNKNEIIGEWGPRPSLATQMVEDYKKEHGHLTSEFKQDLQVWYNKDKGQNIQEDLLKLLTLK
ncbi:thioredoxin family protein [Flagellimonas allohymeniacidonis]|uniref:Thioredoxin family protein n=1 Tax=Flagellimonas allohymeniacidonis TaxID=2517819 RepID=A0A4Q8QFE1_9FLAO|nr:thioredoxin family protein [Allomuricauda hymeniacidonis]TAI47928.1 thioredoxin family protein [Allomuricauda hymeniacidonis]